jgi:hypothetical protein
VIVRPEVIVNENCLDAGTEPPLSATCAVKLNEPPTVGVPAIAPDDAFRFSPGGSAPFVIDQVYGAVPPEAFSVAEYAVPTAPDESAGCVVMVRPEVIVNENCLDTGTEPPLSVTCAVKLNEPPTVGVPAMAPDDAFRFSHW